jgi:urease accessory protein
MRAYRVLPSGTWDPAREIDSVMADHDHRHRRRIALDTVRRGRVLIDLPDTVTLREGDGLETEFGVVRVRSADESLLEIHSHDETEMIRIAWHLGNRHLPVQLLGDRIRIRDDHVIAAMIEGLGGHIERVEAPFDPESGAYAGGGHHHHHD